MAIPLEHCLLFSGTLFGIGLFGILSRRNFLFILLSFEIMFNACAFLLIAVSSYLGETDGQVLFLFVLASAAAKASIGLGIAIRYKHIFGSLDIDAGHHMKG